MRNPPTLTGHERTFDPGDVIVTKTDLKGRITYANRVFLNISHLELGNTLEQPHSLIRHPGMPRTIFKLLWERIEAGKEIFAYVVNRAMNGDHYWVFAHVTPSFSETGQVNGYHSNRRVPERRVISDTIRPLYDELCAIEQRGNGRKDGLQGAYDTLHEKLKSRGLDYDRFIFSL
jgi:PAS domain-containing protein